MKIRCKLPECESEHYIVERFKVTQKGAARFNMHLMLQGQGHRAVEPGKYTRLQRKGEHGPIMSDTPAEIADHMPFISAAEEHVLITGLGLGIVLGACLDKPIVTHVTVIEIDQEIIDMVSPYYIKKYPGRATIVCADALEYRPPKGEMYGAVWHDIWPTICEDNIEDMKVLTRRYCRRTEWQGCWCRWECECERRQSRNRCYY